MTDTAQPPHLADQGTWFGHPRGLATLFFTEMWERFSYYGMRGILVLFMLDAIETGGLGLDTSKAGAIYGLYTGFVYLMALPGGWVADRIMGAKNAVFYGGILIAAGQFSLALGSQTQVGFFSGLALIVLGTGLLKPNVSAIVGDLYPEGGARRDAGFSVFYMGINIGAWIGPLACGFLGEGMEGIFPGAWKYAFMAAGTGMVLGLIQYRIGAGLKGVGGPPKLTAEEKGAASKVLWAGLGGLLAAAVILYLLQSQGITSITLEQAAGATIFIIVGLAVAYFAYQIFLGPWNTAEQKRLVVIFFLFIGAALFWSGFEQAGSSLTIFADVFTDRAVMGWEIPASWFQSVNPVFIITFAPIFGWLWLALGRWNPSLPLKFSFGLILLGSGFLVMAWASLYVAGGALVSPGWLVLTYFLHTSGELCLSPIGLSATTKLSPKPLVGQMMGIWFMGAALGNVVAGMVAGQMDPDAMTANPDLLVGLFRNIALFALGSGVLFFLFKGPVKKLAGGVE
ncbi:MAG: peptide MFS transporter [Gemmatimonadetes bacterium]|nr:peptide MFS transporter [Gemmatimonadota bacterium]NNM06296.1 peptide MFS transporter [Gemmatimonadota bacterium]